MYICMLYTTPVVDAFKILIFHNISNNYDLDRIFRGPWRDITLKLLTGNLKTNHKMFLRVT